MGKKRDINKTKQIAKHYVRNGFDMPTAVNSVLNKTYQGNGLNVMASRIKYTPEFIEATKRELARFDKNLISEEFVLSNLYELISDNNIKHSDKVNALTLCSKILQMCKDGQQTVNIGFNIQDLKTIPVKSTVMDVPNNSQQSATNSITT